jgi:hypothetical protein
LNKSSFYYDPESGTYKSRPTTPKISKKKLKNDKLAKKQEKTKKQEKKMDLATKINMPNLGSYDGQGHQNFYLDPENKHKNQRPIDSQDKTYSKNHNLRNTLIDSGYNLDQKLMFESQNPDEIQKSVQNQANNDENPDKKVEKEKKNFNIFKNLFKKKVKNVEDSPEPTVKKNLAKPFIPKIKINEPESDSAKYVSEEGSRKAQSNKDIISPHSIIGNILLAKSAKSSDKFKTAKTNHFMN